MKSLYAVFAGTIVAFAWILLSRMTLPWHTQEFKPFHDEKVMSIVLKDQTPNSGIYTLPAVPGVKAPLTERYKWYEAAAQGPFTFLAVRGSEPKYSMRDRLIIKLVSQFLIALIMVWILLRTGITHPLQAALVIGLIVSCGALSEDLRCWNWWGFPDDMTLLNLADVFIRWFLAGLAMGFVLRKQPEESAG